MLLAVNLFWGNATTPVWDQDEAAYAGFGRSMIVEGRWLAPSFPYAQEHRKVPLAFWLIGLSFSALGINEFALRLPTVIAVFGTMASVWFGAGFLLGRPVARLAAMMLGSMLLFLNLGKIALTDHVLVLCETVAALALLRAVYRPAWRATLLFWLAVALGLLAKGPPAAITTGAMLGFLLVFYPRRRNLVRLHIWFGAPLALLPLAMWAYLAAGEDARYVLFIGYWDVLHRVGTNAIGLGGPPGTYLLALPVLLLPWSGYLLHALAETWRRFRRRQLSYVLLGAWLFGAWVVWEIPFSKRPTYILGAFPAFALILAHQMRRATAGRVRWRTSRALRVGFGANLVAMLILVAGLVGLAVHLGRWPALLPAVVSAAILVGAVVLARIQVARGAAWPAFRALLLGTLVGNGCIWMFIIPSLRETLSATRRVAETLVVQCKPGTPVVIAKAAPLPSLAFYIMRSGLEMRDLLGREDAREPLHVDWSLLWHLQFEELTAQVKAQNPQEPPRAAEAGMRVDRLRRMFAAADPPVAVLDPDQYDAVRDCLGGARVQIIHGWRIDKFKPTDYVLVMPQAGLGALGYSQSPRR